MNSLMRKSRSTYVSHRKISLVLKDYSVFIRPDNKGLGRGKTSIGTAFVVYRLSESENQTITSRFGKRKSFCVEKDYL